MDERERRHRALQIALELQVVDGPDAADERDARRRAGFTPAEWRRLVFLRWLYRCGLLTEEL